MWRRRTHPVHDFRPGSVCRRVAPVLALGIAAASPGSAQVAPPPVSHGVSSWTTAQGLPQGSLAQLALDPGGYLWLGTNAGLVRFDGESFTPARWNAGMTSPDPIRLLAVGPDGALWSIGARSGLGRLAGTRTWEQFAVGPDRFVTGLAVGSGDTVFVSTTTGILRWHGDRWIPEPGVPDSVVGEVRAFALGPGDIRWLGGVRGMARQASGEAARLARGLRCPTVASIAPTTEGSAWVATCAGVEYVGPDARAALVLAGGSLPTVLHLDTAEGALWLGDRHGVRRYEIVARAGRAPDLRPMDVQSLPFEGADVLKLLGDGAGGVWVGTGGAGLWHVRRLAARRLSLAQGLPERRVHHLQPDGADGLWIGSCGGLVRFRGGRVEPTDTNRSGLGGACIKGLLRDRLGGLWVGQHRSLMRIGADGRATERIFLSGDPGYDISPVLEDREGRVWFGTAGGRVGYFVAADSAPRFLPDTLLSRDKVWSIVEDSAGAVWVGQVGRLARFEQGRRTLLLTSRDGVPDGPIRALHVGPSGALWIASYGGGMARYRRSEGVRRLPPRGRPFERMLSALRRDRAGRFWLLGDGGVTVARESELDSAVTLGRPVAGAVELGSAAGVPEGNGGFPNAWLDERADRLWLATVDGVVAVDMAGFPFEHGPPHVQLDEAVLDGTAHPVADSLAVPASVGAVEFHFSSPQLGSLGNDRLSYRLRGHDRRWLDAGATRVARYAGLAPGSYVFEVQVERQTEPVTGATADVAVVVAAHWWERSLVRLAAVLLGIAVLWGLFRRLTRGMHERTQALRREIAERERAERLAADAATELAHVSRLATAGELASSIAHELNQPLAAVMSSAQHARRLAAAGEELGPTLDAIVDQSERAAGVVRSLRAFIHKRPPELAAVALEEVVADALRLLRQELGARGVRVEVEERRERRVPVRGDAVQLQQVLVNLLLNAADAMRALPPDARVVQVRLAGADGHAILGVTDAGPGMPPDVATRVFDPFFTTKPDGLGLGLSLSRTIVEAHGGRLAISAQPGHATTFTVDLPVEAP